MTFCELNVEESNKSMKIIIPPAGQVEGCCKSNVAFFDCVDVHFLKDKKEDTFIDFTNIHNNYNCISKYFNRDGLLSPYNPISIKSYSYYSQNYLNSQLSVIPLRFYYLFYFCITASSKSIHGQPLCTPK